MSMEAGSVVAVVTEQYVSGDQLGRLACELETKEYVLVPKSGLLTDAEREAIEYAICSLGRDDYLNERHAERLQETLERLTERLQ